MTMLGVQVEKIEWKCHDHRLNCGTVSALPCYACDGEDATHWLIVKGMKIPIDDRCMNVPVNELMLRLGLNMERKEDSENGEI